MESIGDQVRPAKRYLTSTEVAELFMVSPVTIRNWTRAGLIEAHVTAGGHRRFLREEVERFAAERGFADAAGDGAMRLLVVDDDPQFPDFVREAIETFAPGVEVELARDGFAAGAQVHSFKPAVMLLDLMMPGLDGFEVCRRVKADASTRHIRVIAVTGYPSPENETRILELGAEACLRKPVSSADILRVLGLETAEEAHGSRT